MQKSIPLSSPALLAFYQSWLANCYTEERTSHGLCVCLGNFIWDELWDSNFNEKQEQMFWDTRETVFDEMKKQFRCAGLSDYVPFNVDHEDYVQECIHKRVHENRFRVQWVQERIVDGSC